MLNVLLSRDTESIDLMPTMYQLMDIIMELNINMMQLSSLDTIPELSLHPDSIMLS